MKTFNILCLILALVLAVSLASVWFIPSVQEFMAGNTMWNGIKNFQKSGGARITDNPSVTGTDPSSAARIVIPYLSYDAAALADLKFFVDGGGTLVLMDDFGYGNQVLAYLGVTARFSGQPLLDPLFCYKNAWFPRIIDFTPGVFPDSLNEVVLNHATALLDVDPAAVLARSSDAAFLDADGSGTLSAGETAGPLPVAARLPQGKGTLVLVSDPSLVINSMINRTGNRAFVDALLSSGGAKTEVLFDTSHLAKTPLDVSKSGLNAFRDSLATPYPSLAVLFIIFIAVYMFVLRHRRVPLEQQ